MTKRQVAREYRAEYGMEMSTLKLARILRKKEPLLFNDVEHARHVLRQIEGKAGEKSKKNSLSVAPEFVIEGDRPRNPYKLPDSDEEEFKPFNIKGHKKGLIINDIHLPYHSVSALTAMIESAKKEDPDFIFLNGDIVDFHSISFFMRDPRKKRFSEELDMLKEFIGRLKAIFNCKIYYKFGNHEERYDSFLFQKAGELVGVEEFSLETLIKNRVPDITIIRDKRLVVIGGLPFIHGHEFGRGVFSPVNAARGLFLQAKHSAVKGDCHNTSEHPEPDIFGKPMMCFSVGCLCGLTPKWLPLNKWNHGFATIEIIGLNKYKFRNYRIYNGEVL